MKPYKNAVSNNPIHIMMKKKRKIAMFYCKALIALISFVLVLNTNANEKFIFNELRTNEIGDFSYKDSIEKEGLSIAQIFRLAVSYSQMEHFKEAIKLFESIIKDENNGFVESSNWYLGLCFLKSEETDKAIKQFKKIAKENNTYSQAAEGILSNLKNGM